MLEVEYRTDPVFGFAIPVRCPGVPEGVLDPASSWPDREEYLRRYRELASRFVENFKKFEEGCPPEVLRAGPMR
jgi:phosphoenolpyruvate carboxykinase (ATP)